MITRVSLAHREQMLRHLEAQADSIRARTDRLRAEITRDAFPRTTSDTICAHCRIRYTRLDGSCICETIR